MFKLTVKRYNRHFKDDISFVIETVYCYDTQIETWLANPKTWSYELLSYKHID